MMIAKLTRPGLRSPASEDDTILWQWPARPLERMAALLGIGGAEAVPTAVILCLQIPVWTMLGAILWWDRETPFLIAMAMLAVAALSLVFSLLGGLRRRATRIVVKKGSLLHRAGFDRQGWQTIPVDAIEAALIYEGDGTVLLFGRDGILLRARHVGNPAALADAIGAPTIAWIPYPTGNWGWSMFFLHVITFAPAVALVGFFTLSPLNLLYGILTFAGLDYWALAIGVFVCWVSGLIVTGHVLTLLVTVTFGHFLLPRVALREFRRMYDIDRRSHGRPASKAGRMDQLAARYVAWCAAIVGAEPLPPLQPELRHSATPEMAAALATREGSAS